MGRRKSCRASSTFACARANGFALKHRAEAGGASDSPVMEDGRLTRPARRGRPGLDSGETRIRGSRNESKVKNRIYPPTREESLECTQTLPLTTLKKPAASSAD